MAGINVTANTPKINFANGDTNTTKILLQIAAPTNQRLKIKRWGVFFNEETGDSTPATPFVINIGKHTASTGGTALTLVKNSIGSETLQSTALHTLTTSTLSTLDSAMVNAQTGYEVIYPLGDEIIIQGGEKFGIEATSGGTVSTGGVDVIVKVWYEE